VGFCNKKNEKNEIVRYKARLVAQGFTQILGVDYEETYSPVVDAITLRFLISLTITENLQMLLMDVVTAYLYGSLDNDIYMKVPEGLKMSEAFKSKSREMYSIKLKRSLYGLKQSGRMWYNRLNEYLIILKCFNMDKTHPLSTPMVVRSLDVKKRSLSAPRK
jgi:Reverse transcriptase (RNA-dependent DNA polymerase)